MIDLHCHLLPGIDDGPDDLGGSLALARLQVEAGVGTVAATPHVSWDMPNEPAAIERRLADVHVALAAAGIPLEVVRGAEVDVVQASERSDAQLAQLTLGGGPWLLLEAPLRSGAGLEVAVHALHARGHRVLIAHPERSPQVHRDVALLQRITRAGAATQVTASSFTGHFGRTVQRFAEQLLAEGLVHSVASDAHDTVRRPPGIAGALEAAGIGELTELLAHDVPAAILAGDPLPPVPAWRRRRRSLRSRLTRRD